jgi:hypothetical protein
MVFCSNDKIEQRVKINGLAPAQIFLGSNFTIYYSGFILNVQTTYIDVVCTKSNMAIL